MGLYIKRQIWITIQILMQNCMAKNMVIYTQDTQDNTLKICVS